jgi:hypothetical protein
MRKIKVGIASVNEYEDILEFDDGVSSEEIEENVREWAANHYDFWWEEYPGGEE